MSAYRAQVILKTVDAIPANYVTNSWCLSVSPDGALDTDEVTVALKDFYDDMINFIPSVIAQNGHEIKYSELPGVKPNYPFEEDVFNLVSAPTSDPMPTEVALVLSFQGIRQAGFSQKRRRGRIYFGPVRATASAAGRPTSAIITALATAGATFKSNIEAVTGGAHSWAVWSNVDQDSVDIANGWVDNAFDTQRRRGVLATSRTTFV